MHVLHVIRREDMVIKEMEIISKGRLESFFTSTTLSQYFM